MGYVRNVQPEPARRGRLGREREGLDLRQRFLSVLGGGVPDHALDLHPVLAEPPRHRVAVSWGLQLQFDRRVGRDHFHQHDQVAFLTDLHQRDVGDHRPGGTGIGQNRRTESQADEALSESHGRCSFHPTPCWTHRPRYGFRAAEKRAGRNPPVGRS